MNYSRFFSERKEGLSTKLFAGFMMCALNLSMGGAILVPSFAYAASVEVGANETVDYDSVVNPNNAWEGNSGHAVFSAMTDFAEYGFPDLGIPAGASIEGVEVSLVASTNKDDKPRTSLFLCGILLKPPMRSLLQKSQHCPNQIR